MTFHNVIIYDINSNGTLPGIKERAYKISQPGKHMTFHNMIIYDINSNGTLPGIKDRAYKISQPGKHITFHLNGNGYVLNRKSHCMSHPTP